MDFVGDGRFFFPVISSKARMATFEFQKYICFQIKGAGLPTLRSPNQTQVAAVVQVHRKTDDDPETSFTSPFPRFSIFPPSQIKSK